MSVTISEIYDLVFRDGLYYKKSTNIPFTGKVDGITQGSFKDGKKEGSWVRYWRNGQLWNKGEYKNGEKEGNWFGYWDNGQLMYKGDWECGGKWNKNSKEEGYWVFYNKDGTINKESSGTYKFGVKMFD